MRILRLLAAAALLVAAMTIASSPVAAKSGDVVKTGSCTGAADWKLKAGKDNGRIEVEFEVDSNHNGQVWRVKLIDNGVLRHRGRHTTMAPSGSFTVRRLIPNMAGPDDIVARARNLSSGQLCVAKLTI